ncbi:MAG: RsmD family RNA methyltransferase [Kiritimatiellae bacterium]|nr:RsmD family RNA methyltransferase [Kiritimatiellia bacterium]
MRITGGEWGGRSLRTPPPGSEVRPTQDWVREALFSIFQARLAGNDWIDLYAGCGTIGLEALSRGAARVTWVEKDIRNVRLILENFLAFARPDAAAPDPAAVPLRPTARPVHRENARHVPAFPLPETFPGTELVCADALSWLQGGGRGRRADVLYADPPYADALRAGFGGHLRLAAEHDVVKPDGYFAAEMPFGMAAAPADGWEILRDRQYGRTRLVVWRRKA